MVVSIYPTSAFTLCENLINHIAVDICQSEITASVAMREPLVVKSHEMQHGGVQIVEMDFALDGAVPKVVRCTVGESRLDTATGHPSTETLLLMLASMRLDRRSA